MDMATIKSYCAQLECFEHNETLLHAYCGLSVHAAGILCHSVISKRYYLIHAHCCLQHPLIYKHVRYCNIYSIIWLADFQFQVLYEGVIHFYFSMRVGHLFLAIFFNGGGGH